jgi:RimJ/RimL family protein N-acetyltransferase
LLLIWSWIQKDRIAKYWTDPSDFEEFKVKYLETKPSRFVFGFLIFDHHKPIGYIQYYHASRVGGGWWPHASETTFGLDYLLGDDGYVARRLSTPILKLFIDKVHHETPCTDLIADPDPSNLAAVRMFERAGFISRGMTPTPYGDSLLLTYVYDQNL